MTEVLHARRLRDGRSATLVRCTLCGLRRWIIGADATHEVRSQLLESCCGCDDVPYRGA
jgi:hypothetical protein